MSATLLEPWLDKRKAAEHFSCSVRALEHAMHRGLPYAVIFGRAKFRASEVEAWLTAHGEIELHGERDTLPSPDEREAA